MEKMKLVRHKNDRLYLYMDERLPGLVGEDNTLEIRPFLGAISPSEMPADVMWAAWGNQFLANLCNGNRMAIEDVAELLLEEGQLSVEVQFGYDVNLTVGDACQNLRFYPLNTNLKNKGWHSYEMVEIRDGAVHSSFRIENDAFGDTPVLGHNLLGSAVCQCLPDRVSGVLDAMRSEEGFCEVAGVSFRTLRLAQVDGKRVLRVGLRADVSLSSEAEGDNLLAGGDIPVTWNYIDFIPYE